MAKRKTVKVVENNNEKAFVVPCTEDVTTGTVLNAIPTTWLQTTNDDHESNVIPCTSAKILRIFCFLGN